MDQFSPLFSSLLPTNRPFQPLPTQPTLPFLSPSSIVVPSPTLPVGCQLPPIENDKLPQKVSLQSFVKSAFSPPVPNSSLENPFSILLNGGALVNANGYPSIVPARVMTLLPDMKTDSSDSRSRSDSQDSDDDEKEDKRRRWKSEKKIRGKHKCTHPGCDDSFQSKFSLRRHMKTHTGERPFVCTWQDPYQPGATPCGKRFAENSTLKRHVQTHTGEKPYSCPWSSCRKLFADNVNLKRHLRLVHEDSKPSSS